MQDCAFLETFPLSFFPSTSTFSLLALKDQLTHHRLPLTDFTMFFTPFTVLLALAFHVDALPSRVVISSDIPPNAHKVAFDEVNKRLIAFDGEGRNLGHYHFNSTLPIKRDEDKASDCHPMTQEDLVNFPNISKMEEKIRSDDNYPGDVKYEMVVNPPNNAIEHMAEVCASNKGAVLKDDLQPECQIDQFKKTGGENDGKLVFKQALNTIAYPIISVQTQSVYAEGKSFTVNNVPGFWDENLDLKFSNTKEERVRIKKTKYIEQQVKIPIDHSPSCTVIQPTTTCVLFGSAELGIVLRGWVMFTYEKKVGPKDNQHNIWAFQIERFLPQEQDRSSSIKFKIAGARRSADHFTQEGCSDTEFEVSPLVSSESHW